MQKTKSQLTKKEVEAYKKIGKDIISFKRRIKQRALKKTYRQKRQMQLFSLQSSENDFLQTVTRENIKGDFEKWKIFCERERDCMLLGVRI